jgi:hypothetical protein
MDSYNESLYSTSSLVSHDDDTGALGDVSSLRRTPTTARGADEETFIQKYLSRIITAILAIVLLGLVFVLLPTYAVHAAKESRWDETLYWTAGAFVLVAVPVSVHGIIQHLVNVRFKRMDTHLPPFHVFRFWDSTSLILRFLYRITQYYMPQVQKVRTVIRILC